MKKHLISKFFVVFIGLFLLGACRNKDTAKDKPVTIHYSAAASLKEALTDIKELYENKYPATKIQLDFGGSGAIREKVMAGAPIDGVLLASKKDTDLLIEKKKLVNEQVILKNTLVLITNKKNNPTGDLKAILSNANKIAIGNPKTVPAGDYADKSLAFFGLKETLKDKLVQTTDVRQVLSYIEAGNADYGFVYKTDALLSSKVKILEEIPSKAHPEILYYTGKIKDTKNAKAVDDFNQFILSKDGEHILGKYGFSLAK